MKKINKITKVLFGLILSVLLISTGTQAITSPAPRASFVYPTESSPEYPTTLREIPVFLRFGSVGVHLVGKNIKVGLLIKDGLEGNANQVNLMQKGLYIKFKPQSSTASYTIDFEKVTLPYNEFNSVNKGINVIYCIYQVEGAEENSFEYCQNDDVPENPDGSVVPEKVTLYYNPAQNYTSDITPLYRFYSEPKAGHFYTTNSDEKYKLISSDPSWDYEGIAYNLGNIDAQKNCSDVNKSKIYRFWNATSQHHFYTLNEAEKSSLISTNPNWTYEGVAFCGNKDAQVCTQSLSTPCAKPVYRFFSKERVGHFFTMNEDEKNYLINQDPSWKYEDIAYYAFE